MKGIVFLHAWVLLGLLGLPPLAWWLGRRGQGPAIVLPTLLGLPRLAAPPRRQRGAWAWAWVLAPVALGLLALARPRWPRGETPDPSRGIDIMLTLEFSRSMAE